MDEPQVVSTEGGSKTITTREEEHEPRFVEINGHVVRNTPENREWALQNPLWER